MTHLDDAQLEGVLAGMPYPAHVWEIVAWAEFNGAWPAILDPLYSIPEKQYSATHEIVDAVRARGALTAAEPVCRHRRHPRTCSAHRETVEPLAS